MSIHVAANVVQSIAGIEFFEQTAAFLKAVWVILCTIGRVLAFLIAMAIGASVPLTIMAVAVWIMVGD